MHARSRFHRDRWSDYFSEEKRDARSETSQVAPGIPAYQIRNTAVDDRYRIEKEVLTDPWRDVVLQRVRFVPLQGTLADFRLYVLLAPHLANRGSGNTAWAGEYKGAPMLFAEREHYALALASTAPWLARSAGFVGMSDGWQELQANKRLSQTYTRAENGNVAVTGEIDLASSNGTFVMALGFGPTAMEAGQHALISLLEDFNDIQAEYVRAWKAWHAKLKGGIPPISTDFSDMELAHPKPLRCRSDWPRGTTRRFHTSDDCAAAIQVTRATKTARTPTHLSCGQRR
jgi:glucoamylase